MWTLLLLAATVRSLVHMQLRLFWLQQAQPLGQSISLKFSLETRLESESFEPLIDFVAFVVQKLRSKISKLINYLIG